MKSLGSEEAAAELLGWTPSRECGMQCKQRNVMGVVYLGEKMAKLNHGDVQLAFLRDGREGLEAIIAGKEASAHTIKRAYKELQNNPGKTTKKQLKEFGALLESSAILVSGEPLQRPEAGDKRKYKVQLEGRRLVLSVPVDYLEVSKGDELEVAFGVNGFRVSIPE